MNPNDGRSLESLILTKLLAVDYQPVTPGVLARQLQLSRDQGQQFRETLTTLLESGRARQDKHGRIKPRGSTGSATGIVKRIQSGAGWVIPQQPLPELHGGDIYVASRDLGDAQSGDEVQVRLTSRRRTGGQRCGIVEKVLKRATSTFVGTWFEQGGQGYVRIDGSQYPDPIHIPDSGARGPRRDDKVVIEMLRFPSERRAGEAVITQILGKRGDPGIDTKTVIHSLGLPVEFPAAALDEARAAATRFDEDQIGDRTDLTGETIITIDPSDARDFDDAISLSRSADGTWHLAVHIADVSTFVTPGSELDQEAQKRGTSVYLPGHVIPMLPELLSNGLASLQQDQIRWTKSVFIDISPDGSVLGSDFENAAIRNCRRFAYEEVMPLIRQPDSVAARREDPKVIRLLQQMFELAMLLRRRRTEHGALQMGIPEIEIDFDKDGHVTGAHERHHDESHEIIEEFMLLANITVARALTTHRIPFLRRVHGDPDVLRMTSFQQFVTGLGLTLRKPQSRQELQQLVRKAAGQPIERAVNFALLRAMKQAEYSPEDLGHYALAEEDYCHFTSPIRRYPDLTVHRLIEQLIRDRKQPQPAFSELVQLGRHCSFTERRAERAERDLIRIRLLRFMSTRVGQEMDAIITGVESFGIFCQGIEIPAEGMLHVSGMGEDYWEFDPVGRSLTNTRTRRQLRLGDPIRVIIAAVDIDRRQLDLAPAGNANRRSARTVSTVPAGRPGPLPPRKDADTDTPTGNGKSRSKKTSTGKQSSGPRGQSNNRQRGGESSGARNAPNSKSRNGNRSDQSRRR
ncbi:MAG: Ribonuclease, partial [Planctomycetota bacterium]